tara:strand:+ start:3353 stop:3610 length:258 start_codon:yes stop_codon:yes gene_type:complete
MPMDKYKSFFEIVKILTKLDLTKLRAIEKEIRVLGKIKSKVTRKRRKGTKKGAVRRTARRAYEPTAKQKRARKLFAMRAKRGDFR